MKKNLQKLRSYLLFMVFLSAAGAYGQLATWNPNGLGSSWGPNPWNPASIGTNTTVTGFVRGSGLGTSGSAASNSYGGSGTDSNTATDAINSNQFFTFTVKANTGYVTSITGISNWYMRRSSAGAKSVVVQYKRTDAANSAYNDSDFVTIETATVNTTSGTGSLSSISFPTAAVTALSELPSTTTVTFRFLATEAGNGGNLYLSIGSGVRFQLDGATTLPPSKLSHIRRNTTFAEPQNIAYNLYQGSGVTTLTNSVTIASFDIVDGNGTPDDDNSPTNLSRIVFNVENYQNVRRIAIYDGNTKRGEAVVNSGTIIFNSLTNFIAPDNGTKNFTLRAIFQPSVTDNEQVKITVTEASTAASNSSKFAETNAGGASTAVTGDANRIEVTATRLYFARQPSNTLVDAVMQNGVVLRLYDQLNNYDLDFDSNITVTSSGTLQGALQQQPVNGIVTFDNIIHTLAGTDLKLTAAGGSITGTSANFNILPYTLSIDNLQALDKTYDGTTTATLTYHGLLNVNPAHDVNIATYTANFIDKNSGQDKSIAASFTLGGADAGKYALTEPTPIIADIIKKELTLSGISIENKNYDATNSATITGTPELAGILEGEEVSVDATNATAQFITNEVGENIAVTVSGYALLGADAQNYSVSQPTGLTASIISTGLQNQTINFTEPAAVTYGDADFNLIATTTSGLEITFSSSDESVATISGNVVTVTGAGIVTITASQNGNEEYDPAEAVSYQLLVSPKTLTVNNAGALTKIYDATTTANLSGELFGIVGSDNVVLSSTGSFADAAAGENKTVIGQYTISGTEADNYVIQQPATLTGTITQRVLTLDNALAQDKVYDSTTNALVTGTLQNVIEGDDVAYTANANFASKNVGQDVDVTANIILTGEKAANYTVTQPTGLTADITLATINVVATAQNKVYDRTTVAAITVVSLSGNIEGDTVTVTGSGSFNNYNTGTEKPVTANLVLEGEDAINYILIQPTGLSASITVKEVTADISGATVTDKTYDGNTNATVSGVLLDGIVNGDETDAVVVSASFAQSETGTAIPVSNFVLSGDAADNYSLVQPAGTLNGNINGIIITMPDAVAQNKVYDATTSAVITGTLTGVVAGDNVTYTGNGIFASEDVANNINVTAAITLSGTDAANYQIIQPTGLTANITPKAVTVTAQAVSKTYDGTTATTVENAIIASGVISPDDVMVSPSVDGTFNNAVVGADKPVSATFTLSGADAANYTVTPETYPANIIPATLTADVSNATVTTKIYNGNANAQVNGVVVNGFTEGDVVNIVSGSFNDINAGTGITVTLELSGEDAANYTLTQPQPGISGTITKKDITATADNITKAQGVSNPELTISYTGLVEGETAQNAFNFVAPAAVTTATTDSPMGAYPITLSGGSAANYTFTALNNGWLTVGGGGASGSLWLNNIDGTNPATKNPFTDGDVVADKLTVSGIGYGPGLKNSTGQGRYTLIQWGIGGTTSAPSTFGEDDYIEFTLTPDDGYALNLETLTYNSYKITFGPRNYIIRSSIDNFTTDVFTYTKLANENQPFETVVDLSGQDFQNVAGSITFRLYAWGSTNPNAGFYSIQDFEFTGSIAPGVELPEVTSALEVTVNYGDTTPYQFTASGTPQLDLSVANLPAGATVNADNLISFDGTTMPGVYNIELSASSHYGTDTKTLVYTVNKLNQTLTFDPDPIPAQYVGNAPFLFEVNNTAGLPVNWSSSDENVVTIAADGTVTIINAGTATITAFNDGTEIYNPVTETRVVTVNPPCYAWTGNVSNEWNNAANWCQGLVPSSEYDVTISASDNNPVINSGIAYAKTLTVEAGASLTVVSGATLSVEGSIQIDTAATVTVENNAAVLQSSVATENTNTGKITFHKKGSKLYRFDYTMWSSPVANQNLADFSPNTEIGRFYTYNPVSGAYAKQEEATTDFATGRSYLIRMPNTVDELPGYYNGQASLQYNGIFSGIPNNGTLTIPLSNQGDRFNAIGNPYPSPINVEDFILGNAGNIEASSGLYFWRKRNNGNNPSYAVLTLAAFTANPAEGGGADQAHFFEGIDGEDNADQWTLAAGQGFIVKVADIPNPQIRFTNSMRTASPGAEQAFLRQAKPSNTNAYRSRLWVNLTAENGSASQAAIAYMQQATTGIDYGYDGKRVNTGNTISVYSIADNTALSVQARPEFTSTDIVPMGYTAPAAGTYTIAIDHTDGVFSNGQTIYIRDNAQGVVRNLSEGDYSFSTEAGTIEGRFDILYIDTTLNVDTPVLNPDTVIVYKQGNTIKVNTGDTEMNSLTIYDIRGTKVYSLNNINATETAISNLTAEQQVLIIEINTVKGKVSKRIVF